MGTDAQDAVPGLGTLHRACIWESILLKAGLASRGIEATSLDESSPDEAAAAPPAPLAGNTLSGTTNGIQPESTISESPLKSQAHVNQPDGAREHNAKALQHLTHGLPSALAPFFQGWSNCIIRGMGLTYSTIAIVKLFHARRNPDPVQRRQIMGSASNIAQVMLKHISEKGLGGFCFWHIFCSPNSSK